jgi:hypothetical protein
MTVAGKGLLLDFGGVLTASLYDRMAGFSVAAGLPADAMRNCVFVDDTPGHVRAARAVGMAAVHFTGEPGQLAEVERLIGLP